MLVAMETGTGKTFTMANEVYRLMKSGVAKRVRFEPEPGLKFDKIYEVYSQRFQTGDFNEEDKYDPKVLPSRDAIPRPTTPRRFPFLLSTWNSDVPRTS
jgi:type I restriction enzyme, R subunit